MRTLPTALESVREDVPILSDAPPPSRKKSGPISYTNIFLCQTFFTLLPACLGKLRYRDFSSFSSVPRSVSPPAPLSFFVRISFRCPSRFSATLSAQKRRGGRRRGGGGGPPIPPKEGREEELSRRKSGRLVDSSLPQQRYRHRRRRRESSSLDLLAAEIPLKWLLLLLIPPPFWWEPMLPTTEQPSSSLPSAQMPRYNGNRLRLPSLPLRGCPPFLLSPPPPTPEGKAISF